MIENSALKAAKVSASIPLFPLKTIIFPGGLLPLKIFEPRYVDMVSECMKKGTGFGICAIHEGEEAQGIAEICTVGTEVQIIDFESLSGGLLGITVEGQQKFNVVSSHQQDNHLYIGDIHYIEQEKVKKIPKKYKQLAELLKRILPEVEEYYGKGHMANMEHQFDDASWVGSRLVEFLPLGLDMKQMYLECCDPIERLHALYESLHKAHAQ